MDTTDTFDALRPQPVSRSIRARLGNDKALPWAILADLFSMAKVGSATAAEDFELETLSTNAR